MFPKNEDSTSLEEYATLYLGTVFQLAMGTVDAFPMWLLPLPEHNHNVFFQWLRGLEKHFGAKFQFPFPGRTVL